MFYRSSMGVIVVAAVLLTAVGNAQAHDEAKYPDWKGQWTSAHGSFRPQANSLGMGPHGPAGAETAPLFQDYAARYILRF
jgi:hypothetical protein